MRLKLALMSSKEQNKSKRLVTRTSNNSQAKEGCKKKKTPLK